MSAIQLLPVIQKIVPMVQLEHITETLTLWLIHSNESFHQTLFNHIANNRNDQQLNINGRTKKSHP